MKAPYSVIGHCDSRAAWLELRQTGIGASDVAAVLGVSPWGSPVSVFTDKLLGGEREDSEPMFWGRRLEETILNHFGDVTGRHVRLGGELLRSTRWPFLLATLDGYQIDENNCKGTVEIKNTSFRMSEIPQHYWIQIQAQMAVTGDSWASFAALCMGNTFFWKDVQRNDTFITEALVPACEAFWKRVEERGPTPATDATDATTKALARLYPQDDGQTIELSGEYLDLDINRQRVMQELAKLEVEKKGIDNAIKGRLGEATTALLPNGRKYTWKTNKNGSRVFRAPAIEETQSA